jgi:hypothetical protein
MGKGIGVCTIIMVTTWRDDLGSLEKIGLTNEIICNQSARLLRQGLNSRAKAGGIGVSTTIMMVTIKRIVGVTATNAAGACAADGSDEKIRLTNDIMGNKSAKLRRQGFDSRAKGTCVGVSTIIMLTTKGAVGRTAANAAGALDDVGNHEKIWHTNDIMWTQSARLLLQGLNSRGEGWHVGVSTIITMVTLHAVGLTATDAAGACAGMGSREKIRLTHDIMVMQSARLLRQGLNSRANGWGLGVSAIIMVTTWLAVGRTATNAAGACADVGSREKIRHTNDIMGNQSARLLHRGLNSRANGRGLGVSTIIMVTT